MLHEKAEQKAVAHHQNVHREEIHGGGGGGEGEKKKKKKELGKRKEGQTIKELYLDFVKIVDIPPSPPKNKKAKGRGVGVGEGPDIFCGPGGLRRV